MDFNFLFPGRVTLMRGAASKIGGIVRRHMKKACIFRYGELFYTSGVYDKIKKSLDENGVDSVLFYHVSGEPSPKVINDAAEFIRVSGCDGALAVGGGSVIDAAKAACALAPNGEDIMEYIEGFDPKGFTEPPLPVVAMPTTAGTGSEATKNSVITQKGRFKNSVRDDRMIPVAAVIDAELAVDVPKEATVNAGADCICHLVECYVTKSANPLSDSLTLGFMKSAYDSLVKICADGKNVDARESMALAACAAGIAMCNTGLGAAHGIAAGMGALSPLPHGLICGVLLPHVMEFNISRGVTKYAGIARAITGKRYDRDESAAKSAVSVIRRLNEIVGIPADFKSLGIEKKEIPAIAKASMGSSMGKNPFEVTLKECEELLGKLI